MVRLSSWVLLASLVSGCGTAPAPTPTGEPPQPKPVDPVAPVLEPANNTEIKLPESQSAKTLDKAEPQAIYLHVNEQGRVLLAPADRWEASEGNVIESLDNPVQVEFYLKRRAKEDRLAGRAENNDKAPRSLIVLRVHKETTFEKTYGIMKATRRAGYQRLQVRALRSPDGREGQIALNFA